MARSDRVVFWDLETTKAHVAMDVYTLYRKGGYSFTPYDVAEPTRVFSFVTKVLAKRPVFDIAVTRDDQKRMVTALHEILSGADILVGWNSQQFDWRHVQREFLEAGLPRIPEPFQVDLMKVVRKNFNFMSASLAYVSRRLLPEADAKIHLDVPVETLYRAILAGDRKAERLLRQYNTRDVTALEKLWPILLPYVRLPHADPVASLTEDGDKVCPTCGSTDTIARGSRRTLQGVYPRRTCANGHWYQVGRSTVMARTRGL